MPILAGTFIGRAAVAGGPPPESTVNRPFLAPLEALHRGESIAEELTSLAETGSSKRLLEGWAMGTQAETEDGLGAMSFGKMALTFLFPE